MKRLIFSLVVVVSLAIGSRGGEIDGGGRSAPTPTPTPEIPVNTTQNGDTTVWIDIVMALLSVQP